MKNRKQRGNKQSNSIERERDMSRYEKIKNLELSHRAVVVYYYLCERADKEENVGRQFRQLHGN